MDALGWKVRLKRVGPGIFFSVVGLIGLTVSITTPISIKAPDGSTVSYFVTTSSDEIEARDAIRAINTLTFVVSATASARGSAEDQMLDRALDIIFKMKDAYARSLYPEDFDNFRTLLQRERLDPSLRTVIDTKLSTSSG